MSSSRAKPGFRLFGTQNPPSTYEGRKVLSRAFRNRFIELHFDQLPSTELEIILTGRCISGEKILHCEAVTAVGGAGPVGGGALGLAGWVVNRGRRRTKWGGGPLGIDWPGGS